jgi:predicted 3-demethylubiquinone-9 3-methyltransferase (glyoxalase superfamily)
MHDTPLGDCDVVSFTVFGQPFMSISAGPMFKFNPSISFMVNFDPSQDADAKTRIDAVWAKLAEAGNVLMPLDKDPFSERYGWVADKFGVSWQLITDRLLLGKAVCCSAGRKCGWLKDKYGLSWQVVPADMDQMMQDQDPERTARVTKAFLKMKKFDLAELRRAYEGK